MIWDVAKIINCLGRPRISLFPQQAERAKQRQLQIRNNKGSQRNGFLFFVILYFKKSASECFESQIFNKVPTYCSYNVARINYNIKP